MPSPKFKVDDQVNKKKAAGVSLYISPAIGTVIEVLEKLNSRDRVCYYYVLKWPDGRRSEHAQHILVPAP